LPLELWEVGCFGRGDGKFLSSILFLRETSSSLIWGFGVTCPSKLISSRFTGPVGHMVEEEGILGQEATEQAREVLEHAKHERHQV